MSQLEIKLLKKIEEAGYPTPERDTADFIPGRQYEADFLWRFPNGPYAGLAVEVQGGHWMRAQPDKKGIRRGVGHASPQHIERDCEKLCLGTLSGWLMLLVTGKMIRDGRALEWIRQGLVIGGLIEQPAGLLD